MLSGLEPVGVLCEVVDDDGSMARLPKLQQFAQTNGIKIISIADLIRITQMKTESEPAKLIYAMFELQMKSNVKGSQIMSKAAILLSTVQKKQQQRQKVSMENGGITVPDTPQPKWVSSSSSITDTLYVTAAHDRIVPSTYCTTPHHRQTPNHHSGGVPPFSAAAKLVQEYTSSAPGSPRSETSTAKHEDTNEV
ncbi:unnamed protein product [Cuscuta campestris]|uniref:3,4-dihydroxy-2-butanone-4-phosphate synthase n=1 Tax=Cuscuta campestris TaxID=132261 RepID=A0A484LVF6_9ASTE|nr:unnamed protein product [Cuscuta campestris]